jgi:hypothetical protein
MTIKIPKKTTGDRVLKALGKKRGVHIPAETYKEFGPYAYATAQKESFLSALLRPKNEPLPEGMVEFDSLEQRDFQEQTNPPKKR